MEDKLFIDIDFDELDTHSNTKVISVELDELEHFNTKTISLELSDLSFPTIDISKKDLDNLEKVIQASRKNFNWDSISRINACHGTKSRSAANSIITNGWKVGSGNALGSGIYFGAKQNGKIEMPKEGKNSNSGTVADSYGRNGALIFLYIDWNRLKKLPQNRVNQYGGGGDNITKEALRDGYDYFLSHGAGVMFEPQFRDTKKYWKTDKMKIVAVYYHDNKKVKIFE